MGVGVQSVPNQSIDVFIEIVGFCNLTVPSRKNNYNFKNKISDNITNGPKNNESILLEFSRPIFIN